jgi:MYXO-CTERM domain-containing protein
MAANVQIRFNGTEGETTNLWWGYSAGGSNTGGNQGQILLTRPTDDWYFPASLLRVKQFPSDFAGATINSATFTIRDNWGNNAIHGGVELHRIDTPAVWKVGDGVTNPGRWPDSLIDNGAGRRVADWNRNASPTNGREGTGVDWAGNPVVGTSAANYYSFASSLPSFEQVALKELIDTKRVIGGGMFETAPGSGVWIPYVPDSALQPGEVRGQTDFNVTTLVQNWANGSWDKDDGFALWMGNATLDFPGNVTQGLSAQGGNGLFIDYTPVPEPAAFSLLGLGGLWFLRRRRAA